MAKQTPLGRIGEPNDVELRRGLPCSDASSWITGTTTVIDGGQMLGNVERRAFNSDQG